MKTIQDHWRWLVTQTAAQQRTRDEASVWGLTAKLHPDAAILLRAAGATRSQVIQFTNSQMLPDTKTARKQFANAVAQDMKETHADYHLAYNRNFANRAAHLTHVEITLPGQKRKAQFTNDAAGDTGGVPALGPELRAIFKLPPDTTADEWKAAWTANQSKAFPFNPGACLDALCQLYQKTKGADYEAALTAMKSRFPDLWQAVQQIAAM
ncbi:MAG TPA: hypothetical protein VGI03_07075 [Verrucomicrobiae bacterium]|jgi:hypothetical protein